MDKVIFSGFTTPEIDREAWRKKNALDPLAIARKNADYCLEDFEGGVRKYSYMRDRSGNARWYSKKEYLALRAAGKNIITDM